MSQRCHEETCAEICAILRRADPVELLIRNSCAKFQRSTPEPSTARYCLKRTASCWLDILKPAAAEGSADE
jgi:hypothetical protein